MLKSILLISLIVFASSNVRNLPKLSMYAGRGYNLLRGNPQSNGIDPGFQHSIFTFTYNSNQTTDDGKYLIPDNVSHRKATACSFSTSVSEHRGTESYQNQLKTKTQVSGGYSGPLVKASFSSSVAYQKMHNQTISQNRTVTHASAECQTYELSINIFNIQEISTNFWMGLKSSYNSNNWTAFIEQFGSHYVHEVVMGGRAIQEIKYDWKSVSELEGLSVDINIVAHASFASFVADSSFDYKKYENQTKYSQELRQSVERIYIGGQPPRDGNVYEWQSKIIDDPMPISYKVLPVSDLFHMNPDSIDASDATNKFYHALDLYCQQNNCKAPTPDKPKPAPPKILQQRTTAYGGNGGSEFEWKYMNPTYNVKTVIVRSGKQVDRIQFIVGDAVTGVYTPQFGGNGGSDRTPWNVPKGEYITQVEYRSGDRVDSLCFITNKQTRSQKYGGGGGSYHMQTFPEGYRLVGMYGRGGSRVDKLGFILAKTDFQTGEIQIMKKNLVVQK